MNSTELLSRVASYGLPDRVGPIAGQPLDGTAWAGLMSPVRYQRLIGHLSRAVEAGDLPVTDEQRAEVAEQDLENCVRALHLDRRLLELTAQLESDGIEVVVLKGTANAHLIYPDPATRAFGDNDLLFRAAQFEDAVQALKELGYVRQVAPPQREFALRFSKGATLKGPEGDEADLHRNLVFGTFGFAIELDGLFDSCVKFELGGRRVRALGPETRLLHACYHSALGDPDPRYSSLRDVAQMLAFGTHDNRRVLELARRWRSTAVLARAFRLCREHLGVELKGPLVSAVAGYEPTRRERRAIASYVGENRHYAAKVAASLPYLDGVGTKIAFLRASALPSEEFIESRGNEPRSAWIRRGLQSLLQGGLR